MEAQTSDPTSQEHNVRWDCRANKGAEPAVCGMSLGSSRSARLKGVTATRSDSISRMKDDEGGGPQPLLRWRTLHVVPKLLRLLSSFYAPVVRDKVQYLVFA